MSSTVKNTDRVKVACINWTYPSAPKATVYILSDGEAKVNTYHETWAEAIERGNYLGHLLYANWVAQTMQGGAMSDDGAWTEMLAEHGCSYCGKPDAVAIGVDEDGDYICKGCALDELP